MAKQKKRKVNVQPARHGLGVFANRRFRANRFIGRIRGRTITDPAYSSNYCMDLGGECSLEPTAPFRYLNHSCAPNCSLVLMQIEYEDGTPSETELWLEANRDIYDGEELTIDYGWPADAAMPCNCGSPNCRGWIVAEELVDGIGQAQ